MASATASSPLRAGLGTLWALFGTRQKVVSGGLPSRVFSWRSPASHKFLLPWSAGGRGPQQQQVETLVTVAAGRWLPRHSRPGGARIPTVLCSITSRTLRPISTSSSDRLRKTSHLTDKDDEKEEPKPSIFKRFKQMYKDYWYVLVPVHLATSAVWFGSFYYASKSGIDIPALLESWNFSESIVEKLRNSSAGHIAVAYMLYKIATPARYAVTLGGTTYSIKVLSERGYIKPVPSRQQMKDMYEDRRDELRDRIRDQRLEWRNHIQRRRRELREQLRERRKRKK